MDISTPPTLEILKGRNNGHFSDSPGKRDKFPGKTWITIFIIGLIMILRAPTLLESMYIVDEAYDATMADDLLNGGVLDRTAADYKPPLMYYIYMGCFKIAGRNSLRAVHLCAILWVILTALSVRRIGVLLADERTGAWAGIGYVVFAHAYLPRDTLPANSELFAALPLTLSILCCLLGERRRRPAWFMLSGVLCALATGMRQPSAVNVAVIFGYLGYTWAIARTARLRRVIVSGGLVAAGFASVIGLGALYYHSRGNLLDVYHWVWTFSFQYVEAETTVLFVLWRIVEVHATFIISGGLLWYFGIRQAIAVLRRRKGDGADKPERMLIVIWFGMTYLTLFIGWRLAGHYHLSVLPSLSVLAALSFTPFLARLRRAGGRRSRRIMRYMTGAAALPAVGYLVMAFIVRTHTLEYKPFVEAIVARTKPDDRIFVWGSYPQLYHFSGRRPASRFISCTQLTGIYSSRPRHGLDPSRSILPGSWDMLKADFEAHPPRLIVDMCLEKHDWRDHPMKRYPFLRDFLSDYRVDGKVDGVVFYVRRHGVAAAPSRTLSD